MSIKDSLVSIAAEQHGLVATWQAGEQGIHSQRLGQLAARGHLERRVRGVYQVTAVPLTEYSEFVEAVLWSKDGAITGESAMLVWDLADVNPRKVHLAVPGRVRREMPANYVLHRMPLPPEALDNERGVVVTSPIISFMVAVDNGTPGHLIRQGIHKAEALELFGDQTATAIKTRLYERDGVSS